MKKKSEVLYIFVLPHANQIRSKLQVKYKRSSSAKTKEKRNLITLLIIIIIISGALHSR